MKILDTKDIALAGVFAALAVVLKSYFSIDTGVFRISLFTLPLMYLSIRNGIVIGGLSGYITDAVYSITKGYGLVPNLMTLSTVMFGILPAIIISLFKNKKYIAFLITVLTTYIVSFILNSIQLYVIWGFTMSVDIYVRIANLLIMSIILSYILHRLNRIDEYQDAS